MHSVVGGVKRLTTGWGEIVDVKPNMTKRYTGVSERIPYLKNEHTNSSIVAYPRASRVRASMSDLFEALLESVLDLSLVLLVVAPCALVKSNNTADSTHPAI